MCFFPYLNLFFTAVKHIFGIFTGLLPDYKTFYYILINDILCNEKY